MWLDHVWSLCYTVATFLHRYVAVFVMCNFQNRTLVAFSLVAFLMCQLHTPNMSACTLERHEDLRETIFWKLHMKGP